MPLDVLTSLYDTLARRRDGSLPWRPCEVRILAGARALAPLLSRWSVHPVTLRDQCSFPICARIRTRVSIIWPC
ncbi:hypothetical protein EXIGLDRAFT_729425 [Exidia glandulosa HHB12029]|uniref:Uncharacterized protein n=1 Tax=Exidia glandulosa HHB12029 TaxID=1314781 RepID=A0A165LIX4_EXIGL|nr:hypothetical protein EXIGLDRAFT_729425 [Exidia glandulosa HHB12029]